MKTSTNNFDPVFTIKNLNDVMTAGSKIAERLIESDCTIRCKEAAVDILEDASALATEMVVLLRQAVVDEKPSTVRLENMVEAFYKKMAALYSEFNSANVNGVEEVLLLQDVFSWGLLINAVRVITQDEDEAKFAAMAVLGHAKRVSSSSPKLH